ncbi:MAG: glycoside hydrolase family 32 protein, partial [Bacteroidales bacterium]|nr:glycoside hydrolase family 32 protein [Bacteroidales bacterium]
MRFKINQIFYLSIMLSCSLHLANAQYYPHKNNTDYREHYRGQFHFSPKSEWMNDINGLVYQGGKYHMIYQWGNKIRHGGYATSLDLLHWEDKGVALIPQKSFLPVEAKRNATGDQVYSGSAVVVSGQTAKKITGSDQEAIIAIYTGTTKGTCLAWSNDGGDIWHDYKGNPVGHLTDYAVPRDPCVFWYEPAK